MISAVVGLPGEGKSLTTSMRIREDLDAGIQVYTNIHLDEKRKNYTFFHTKDWEIILKLQDGVIYFDEGQFILDARNWQNLPVEFRQLLQKGRHEGLDFVVLTQHIMQIDVAYRRLIYDAKRVVRVFSIKKWNIGLFLIFDAEIMGENEVKIDYGIPEFVFATKEDWDYYNSYALRTHKPPVDLHICSVCGIRHELRNTPVNKPINMEISWLSTGCPQVIPIRQI